jgi:hypothetical protein
MPSTDQHPSNKGYEQSQLIDIQNDLELTLSNHKFYFDNPNPHKQEPRNQYPIVFYMS